jgi:hypothetical protein
MPEHEHFEELCALAVSGQISVPDWRSLQEHLQSCPACGRTLGDFAGIGAELMAEFATSVPLGHFAEMRSRFLERARLSGGNVSLDPVDSSRKTRWTIPASLLSGSIAALMVLGVGVAVIRTRMRTEAPAYGRSAPEVAQVSVPGKQVSTAVTVLAPEAVATPANALEQERNALQVKLDAAKVKVAALESSVAEANVKLGAAAQLMAAVQSDRDATVARFAQVQSALEDARSKELSQEVRLASAQGEIDALNKQLLYETANAERLKAIVAGGKDGQSIIAARNLHIIDVYDADGRGARRSFGRVFYVEGQQLVFYAYDLADPRHANAQFYAWGAVAAPGETVTRLGVLRNDGQSEERWVLKYADTSVLAKLDSIFVTAETVDDPEKPKGRRVLFAVLSGQPNHP